jgi:hypothetical protein
MAGVTTSPPPPAAAETFDHVRGMGTHGEDAAAKLSDVHKELVRLGAATDAARLAAVDTAAENRDFDALDRLAVTERPLDELAEIQHSRVRRIVGWRNAIAIVPLMITWLLLGWASLDYRHELGRYPRLSREPFLILWQQSFGGMFIPNFTETALASFVLLAAVLALTVRAHRLESQNGSQIADIGSRLDDAMSSLVLAAKTSPVRPPETAAEWAEAAQRVLTETQQMITTAVRDTEKLADANNKISKTAEQAMTQLQTQAEEFVAGLATEVKELMLAVRADAEQVVTRTAEEAKLVLQQAGAANKQLVEQQMTPLFEGFRASLNDYRADQGVYRASAAALATGVAELTRSAAVMAESSGSYTEIATSIDGQLRQIGTSQTAFVARITENSQSIATATTAMREVTDLMTGPMRTDMEALAKNVVEASARLVAIDGDLKATTTALGDTTGAMGRTASSLDDAAAAAATAASAASAAAAAAASAASSAAAVAPTPPSRPRWQFWRR